MKIFFSIYFLMSLALGFNLYGGDIIDIHSKVTEDLILLAQERKLQQRPFLYVTNFIASSIASGRSDVVLPIGDFLKLRKNSQNVASFLNARQRGYSKGAGRDASKIAIVGSGDVLEAYYSTSGNSIKLVRLGSMNDISVQDSTVNRVLTYAGYNRPISNSEKSFLARRIASGLQSSGNERAVLNWYERSRLLGSRVLAPFDCASYLDKELLRLPVNLRSPELCKYVKDTFDELAQKGHLGAMRAIADRLERQDKFLEASKWYARAVDQKGHKASIKDMVRCADNLWNEYLYDISDSVICYVKNVYELAAYEFGDEKAVNKLANLMRCIDDLIDGGNELAPQKFAALLNECGYICDVSQASRLEKYVLAKQISYCPGKVTSNTYLRLGLLAGLTSDSKLEWKCLENAARLGNLPAMVRLRSLSEGSEDQKRYSDMILAHKRNLLADSLVRDSLIYLASLDEEGYEDLLEEACEEVSMDYDEILELAEKGYSFESSVDPGVLGFPSVDDAAEFKKDCKRECEEDEVCGVIGHKRMKYNRPLLKL